MALAISQEMYPHNKNVASSGCMLHAHNPELATAKPISLNSRGVYVDLTI